jgi:hypothetical protein
MAKVLHLEIPLMEEKAREDGHVVDDVRLTSEEALRTWSAPNTGGI